MLLMTMKVTQANASQTPIRDQRQCEVDIEQFLQRRRRDGLRRMVNRYFDGGCPNGQERQESCDPVYARIVGAAALCAQRYAARKASTATSRRKKRDNGTVPFRSKRYIR